MLVATAVLAALWASRHERERTWVLKGWTMGTTYNVQVVAPEIDAPDLDGEIENILERVNARMSTYREDSEISRFNRSGSPDWFAVSRETAQVVETALQVSRRTQGAFDVTVGPLVDLWGFGPTPRPDAAPSPEAIAERLADVGFRWLHARSTPPALRKDMPGLGIDLSAIAKGHAVDAVADHLDALDIERYLVEVGGEIRARGHNGRGDPWTIGIERPIPGAREVHGRVHLGRQAIATSGDYRNYFEAQGGRFSHTIDPRTGRPVTHDLAEVSVIAPSAMHADAMATALMVLGPRKGLRLAETDQLAAQLVLREGDQFRTVATAAFEPYLVR
jgi:thiamine biosynthesis lipoprotein